VTRRAPFSMDTNLTVSKQTIATQSEPAQVRVRTRSLSSGMRSRAPVCPRRREALRSRAMSMLKWLWRRSCKGKRELRVLRGALKFTGASRANAGLRRRSISAGGMSIAVIVCRTRGRAPTCQRSSSRCSTRARSQRERASAPFPVHRGQWVLATRLRTYEARGLGECGLARRSEDLESSSLKRVAASQS
jgi:hypothetical protein